MISRLGDNVAYAVGYDNGVYTAFLAPVQRLLLDNKFLDKDDFLDLQEALTDAVKIGHGESKSHLHTVRTIKSTLELFPHNGTAPVATDGPYLARIKRVEGWLLSNDNHLFKRRKRIFQELKNTAGGPPFLPPAECILLSYDSPWYAWHDLYNAYACTCYLRC